MGIAWCRNRSPYRDRPNSDGGGESLGSAASGSSREGSSRHYAPGPARPSPLPDHVLRLDPIVELGLADMAEAKRRRAQRETVAVGEKRDLGRLLVADMRAQRGHQHQRMLDVLADRGLV